MALLLKDGSNVMEKIEIPEIDAALLMSLLEESHCEEYCNEEQVNSLMESLEEEIRMAPNHGSCNIEGDMESDNGFDSFEWTDEMETVPSSQSDDMNWYVEDQEISMDEFVQFGNDFPQNFYEVPLEHGYSSLWQDTYEHDIAIYN